MPKTFLQTTNILMSEEKKKYSMRAYLTEEQFKRFEAFVKEENITAQELTDIEGMGRTREAMNARMRKKRIMTAFANKVLETKKKEFEAKQKKIWRFE